LLARPEMRQVAQRVVARYHLSQLSVTEISAYVAHRLRVSGAAAEIFPQSLMKPIFRASGGVPRLINLVCDRALLGTYVGGRQRVTAPTLRQAVREVIAARRPRWHWWPLAAGLMAVAGLVLAEATGLIHAASAWLPWPSTVPLVSSAAPPSPRPESPQPTPTRSNFSEPPEAERTPVLYRNDESGIAAPGPSASVEWPNGILPVNSEAMAFQSLLKRYGMVVDIAAKGDPCRQVEDLGMRCYAGRGGLSDLTLLDQPVVMRLSSAEGHDYSVTLVGLDRVNHVATLLIGDEERRVALRDLAIVWSGRYYAIWKAPRAFHDSLAINQRGPAISWLRQILSTVDGIDDPGTDKFDAALARRIRAFQLAEGIQPDGLVGPLTAIRLNVRSGQLGPRLTAGKGD